ncbi:MAG: DegT/DnrJ/EryC1/StrS family aminotransferase [Desulfuromonadales bacterium]|nr:DegT/DnrJ/EryC1/StrS family aminotransferase [Desulfuromonadales bacterium]
MNFIPISQPSITQKEIDYVTDAVKSGWVSSLGKYIDIFEEKFAEFVGTRYAVTASNGTAALHLAVVAHDIGPGDEVIIPDLTFIATANAVQYTGATVVCVDVDKDSLCIDPRKVEEAITDRTRAIIPVHVYGHPADMVSLRRIAQQHGLVVIEDAAESHGAEVLGKRAGSLGNCGIFSFYGNKIITSGEGGMITTDDQALYERLKVFRDHAMSKERRYWHELVGFNYRMTNLQAALGVAQLERIDELLERKREIFHIYQRLLSGYPGLRLNREAPWAKNVYWMVCLEVEGFSGERRDAFMEQLKQRDIDSRPYFYPVSDMPMYVDADTPVSHELHQRGINLPSYFDLDDASIEYICENIIAILDEG